MKRFYDILTVAIFSAGITLFMYCNRDKKPVGYFKQGQILLPDYAHADTLIVHNAIGLNKAMALVQKNPNWGSDSDCDSLIHVYCTKY